jgi:Fur family ferric uptake transcriptional regulator
LQTADLLKSRDLRLTKPRAAVLDLFQSKIGRAISVKELVEQFQDDIDKVTLYRTLHTFEFCGLIHRIFDDSGLEKYALCTGTCESEKEQHKHDHGHIHFKCEKCLETECISEVQMPKIILPAGYTTNSTNYLVFGHCSKCS